MQHPAGLSHVIRQQGLGNRFARRKWCYEELEKEVDQGGEKASWNGADTRCTNFLIRCDQNHQYLAEWLHYESVPLRRRRRLMQLVLGNFPCGAWVHEKFDEQKSDRCSLCGKALREEMRANFCEQKIPRETVGHISSGATGRRRLLHSHIILSFAI